LETRPEPIEELETEMKPSANAGKKKGSCRETGEEEEGEFCVCGAVKD
jgi:hypothetical protein